MSHGSSNQPSSSASLAAAPQARLCLLAGDGDESVYDSRTGDEREYPLSPLAARVLRHLERPATVEGLDRAFEGVSGFDGATQMAYLKERHLLFEENGRFMSLVVA